jgi:hypothetical protein
VAEQFENIKIIGLDDKASGPSGERALMRMVLQLSKTAPREWSDYFNQAWHNTFYMLKRSAQAHGNTLEIVCMPRELETDHLPQLNKVIAQTNDAYRAFEAKQQQQSQAAAESEQSQRAELSDLKKRLKFD